LPFLKYLDRLWGPPSYFTGVNRTEPEADHSLPPSAEVKDEWRYNSSPHICLHGVNRDYIFTVLLTRRTV